MKPQTALLLALPLALPFVFGCQSATGAEPAAREALEAPSFEVIALQHADARELSSTLSNLFHAVVMSGGDRQVKVIADPRTNSLLLMAPPEHMELVKGLVARLDAKLGN